MQSQNTNHQIELSSGDSISAISMGPSNPVAHFVFAHGAGAGMEHKSMEDLAIKFAQSGVATLRFNFPYMEQGKRSPGSPKKNIITIAEVAKYASNLWPALPQFVGGKSYGGRMTSHAVATGLINDSSGLIFVGYPLHAAGKPSMDRAANLKDVKHAMLFLQGTKDALADVNLIKQVVDGLPTSFLHFENHADHSFQVPKKSGRTNEEVTQSLVTVARQWIAEQI